MKKKLILIVLFLILILTGCSLADKKTNVSNLDKLTPKEVVESYFKYYNEKSRSGMFSTLTKWHNTPNMNFEFDNLKSIKLMDIAEDLDSKPKEAYMKNGRGGINGVKKENMKIYKVTFYVKLKKDGASAMTSGLHIESFTVIRKNENSPWLIDDHGEG